MVYLRKRENYTEFYCAEKLVSKLCYRTNKYYFDLTRSYNDLTQENWEVILNGDICGSISYT